MDKEHLGDSYDAVKRMWASLLLEANHPLYAEQRFFEDLTPQQRESFSKMTGIPMLPEPPPQDYSLLLDPATGVRLEPGKSSRTHISLNDLTAAAAKPGVFCTVCFDQSFRREKGNDAKKRRQIKLKALKDLKCNGFYYASHAPFLFAFSLEENRDAAEKLLLDVGIPAHRIESIER